MLPAGAVLHPTLSEEDSHENNPLGKIPLRGNLVV